MDRHCQSMPGACAGREAAGGSVTPLRTTEASTAVPAVSSRAASTGTPTRHPARPDHPHLCGLPLVLPAFSSL